MNSGETATAATSIRLDRAKWGRNVCSLTNMPDWVEATANRRIGRELHVDDSEIRLVHQAIGVKISRSPILVVMANINAHLGAGGSHYLGRAADPQGLRYWLQQFAAGATNEDVIAGFTGSAEYYKDKAGVNP